MPVSYKVSRATGAETYLASGVEVKVADYTVTAADNGKTFAADAVDLVFTLPPSVDGLTYTFITKTASVTTGLQVSPAAADLINGPGFTPLADKDAINTGGTDAVGDLITIVGDGIDGWYVTNVIGTWAREA